MAKKCQHRAALELFQKIGDTATPAEIDKHVGGTGSYYSKHVSVMRRWGFEFDVEKDGRTIVRYTLTKVPDNEAEYRNTKATKAAPKKATKTAPKKATKTVAPKAKAAPKKDAKAKNLDKMKKVLREKKEREKEMLEILEDEPAAVSYSVDSDWDSTENVDISALL